MNGTNRDPFACKLACHILKEQFGEICEHNFVSCYIQHTEDPRKSTSQTLYEADLAAVLQSLRKPSLLVHIRDEPSESGGAGEGGEEGVHGAEMNEVIMRVLLEQGRLQAEQLFHATALQLQQAVEDVRDNVQRHFLGLVQMRYVERAPGCADPPPVPFQHRKTQRKSAPKPGTVEEARHQAEQQKKLAQAEYEKDRFRLPPSLLQIGQQEEGAKEPPKKKRKWGGSEAAANPQQQQESDGKELVLWRVNRDEFNKRLRHAACVDMVQQKNGPDAAAVLKAMLHATQAFETQPKAEQSSAVSQDEIMSYVRQLQATIPDYDAPQDVATVLRELADDPLQPISYTGEGPGGSTYCANMSQIMRQIRLLETEAVMKQRFGGPGLRVFRLLLLHRQLEQKQVAEKAMLPPKDAKELLYRLFRAGFVGMQEIPRTADHAPSRTLYTWRVDATAAAEKLAADLYKAALNVRVRLEFELNQQSDLFKLIEAGAAVANTHGKQIEKMKHVSKALASNLMRLDQQIAVFNDF